MDLVIGAAHTGIKLYKNVDIEDIAAMVNLCTEEALQLVIDLDIIKEDEEGHWYSEEALETDTYWMAMWKKEKSKIT